MNWYLEVLKKYAVFSGRARRKEYWLFILFNTIISFALILIEYSAGGPGIVAGLYYLAVAIPSLAVLVRRLHDTNRSGWWFFIGFVPLVGGIILFVFTVLDSQPGENRYGPNPKDTAA